MKQSLQLLDTLRKHLKIQGFTYKELALKLGQSESNIKRIFSQKTISLDALESICEAANIELLELARLARTNKTDASIFTLEQEIYLASSPKQFSFTYLLLHDKKLDWILTHYKFTRADVNRFLLDLDKLGVIRLDANDRFKVLLAPNVRWNENGPLAQMHKEGIKNEFMDSDFKGDGEFLRFLRLRMSKQSKKIIKDKVSRLIAEIVSFSEMDELNTQEKKESFWIVLAGRPWNYSFAEKLKK